MKSILFLRTYMGWFLQYRALWTNLVDRWRHPLDDHHTSSNTVLSQNDKNQSSNSDSKISKRIRAFRAITACRCAYIFFFPQQCKPMGSSAQNSSGVHWCRRRVRFNEVPEKVPKVPEKVPGNLGAKPSQVQQGSGESSGEGLGGFGAEPSQVQQGSGEASGEGLGGFGAEPGQVQQGFRRKFRRRFGRLWCRAR